MATSSGVRRRAGISGIIQCIDHAWHVQFHDVGSGVARVLPVAEEDAWNFDIEHNLPVLFRLTGARVKLLSRKGNKRFVTVAKVS